jgi:hypothetical protein
MQSTVRHVQTSIAIITERMRKKSVLFILTGLGVLLLIGCTRAPQPMLHITSPTYGETITTDTITVSVSIRNATLQSAINDGSGQSHLHYYIDRAPSIIQGEPAISQPGTYFSTTATTHTWEHVPTGRHTFSVELVNADDTPHNPVVSDQIQVIVT